MATHGHFTPENKHVGAISAGHEHTHHHIISHIVDVHSKWPDVAPTNNIPPHKPQGRSR